MNIADADIMDANESNLQGDEQESLSLEAIKNDIRRILEEAKHGEPLEPPSSLLELFTMMGFELDEAGKVSIEAIEALPLLSDDPTELWATAEAQAVSDDL